MRVSVNWIKEYTPIDVPVGELVDKIGQQLGAAEETLDLSKVYSGTIVKVVSADPVEGTHLNLCLVDDNGITDNVNRGENGLIQVVCGAPNVKKDMLAVWLAPGVTVPSSVNKEPFILEAREIRGHISNGMLASPRELALYDDHDGILEITDNLKPGDSFASSYDLNDYVVDIENKMFTHRPDCFGQIGVAREIAGIFNNKFTSPEWYLSPLKISDSDNSLPLEIDNQLPDLVPRFSAIALSSVDGSKKSPLWLQSLLVRVGLKPISLIVDITNYMMVLTAQPLHAFDYDKVKALSDGDKAKLIVRHPEDMEQLQLLDGKTVKPGPDAIMISAPKKLLALAGIKGGKDSEVSGATKNIIIECANFDMYTIRRTSMALGQFSDASTRFTKGQSPLQLDRVIAKTVKLLEELAGAKVSSPLIDINQIGELASIYPPISLTLEYINSRLGISLSTKDIAHLLTNVEFSVDSNDDNLIVTAPFWRTDIELPEDIVEEVGRLYGYQHIPISLPTKSIKPALLNPSIEIKSKIRQVLSSAGANELLTYTFVNENLLKVTSQDTKRAYKLSNALSPELGYYRTSIVPSLLDKVHPNIKTVEKDFALFEINPIHILNEMDENELNVPKEYSHLAAVVVAEDKTAKSNYSGAPFYQAKIYLSRLLKQLNINYDLVPIDQSLVSGGFSEAVKTYEPKRSAMVMSKDKMIGLIGEPTISVKRALKLPDFVSIFELDIDVLLSLSEPEKYTQLSHYPRVEQDICFRVEDKITYETLLNLCNEFIGSKMDENTNFSISSVDIYASEKDQQHKQITLRVTLVSYLRTMTDKEVSSLLIDLGAEASAKLGAVIV